MDTFVASTQYTDMRGTVAADESDYQKLDAFLREKGRISEEEYVAGITFFFHSPDFVYVRVFTTSLDDRGLLADASKEGRQIHPASLRKLKVELTLQQFFSFFKRFDVKMVDNGLEGALDGLNIDGMEES
jgi:hypothetical protein